MLLRLFSRLSSRNKIRLTMAILRATKRELRREGRTLSAARVGLAHIDLAAVLDEYDDVVTERSVR